MQIKHFTYQIILKISKKLNACVHLLGAGGGACSSFSFFLDENIFQIKNVGPSEPYSFSVRGMVTHYLKLIMVPLEFKQNIYFYRYLLMCARLAFSSPDSPI